MAKAYKSAIRYRLREVPVGQIRVWKEAQARKLDRAGIAELAKSIRAEGLQNPPMVQKEGREYLLMSGQRRLAALKRLRAKKIPVLVMTRQTQHELGDAKAASVIENMHRRNMSTKETAAACVFLADKKGKAAAARSLGLSQIMFKKYHGFAGVPDALKDMVPREITRDEATKIYQGVPGVDRAVRAARRVSKIEGASVRKRYIKILSQNPRASHASVLGRARATAVQRRFRLELPKSTARRLGAQAGRRGTDPPKLAAKIVSDWVRSHRR